MPKHFLSLSGRYNCRSSSGTKPTVWTQLGVSTNEAQRLAEDAGLPYVNNRCIMVEHRRLIGG